MISNPIGPPAATTLMSAEFPLRGRDDAIDVIDRSIGIVTKGRGAAVLVEGGAGSGKTRLSECATCGGSRVQVGTMISLHTLCPQKFDDLEPDRTPSSHDTDVG